MTTTRCKAIVYPFQMLKTQSRVKMAISNDTYGTNLLLGHNRGHLVFFWRDDRYTLHVVFTGHVGRRKKTNKQKRNTNKKLYTNI